MTDENGKLILLTDILEQKIRKEKELEFYQKELEKLEQKMYWVKREIDVTNTIIRIIQEEKVIDLVEEAEKKLLIRDDD
jgi:hypothetical protein